MLKIQNLQKEYIGFRLNLSMDIPKGRIIGLIGPNGSGKTTAFKAMLGLNQPSGGIVKMFGQNIGPKTDGMTPELQNRIGVAFAESGFSGYLLAADVAPILEAMYKDFNKDAFQEYCKRLNLPLNKKIKDYSTGMKARLRVVVALSHEADFLILDEPTAGMDVVAREELLDLLRDYMADHENCSMIISSHISGDLESICDELYMMKDGEIIFREDTDVLLNAYGVLKVEEEIYQKMDKTYISHALKEPYGYRCLTKERQFYLENYPEIVIEKGTLDDVIYLMMKGVALE